MIAVFFPDDSDSWSIIACREDGKGEQEDALEFFSLMTDRIPEHDSNSNRNSVQLFNV